MATETIAFWVGVVGMLVGAAFVAYRWTTGATEGTRAYYAVALTATGVGAAAYLLMALGIGEMTVTLPGPDPTVQLVRYAGWLVVGPLALAALWLLADASGRQLVALVVLDVLLVGLVAAGALASEGLAGLSVQNTRLALWGGAVVVFLVLAGVLLRALSPQAGRRHRRNPDVAILFSILRNLVVVTWLIYPIVWLVSPTGLAVIGSLVAAAGYLVLDLVSVAGFAALLVRNGATLREAEA